MKNDIIPERFRRPFRAELAHLFRLRVDLFCYITLVMFFLEIALAFSFFRGRLSVKDIPGIAGGMLFSVILLVTGKFYRSLLFQKIRAFFFSLLLIMIAILAATSHPDIITYLGITLVLIAFFLSVLLLPWGWIGSAVIGLFTIINFVWVYRMAGTFVSSEIFGINVCLLTITVFVATIAKRSEDIMRRKGFVSRGEVKERSRIMAKELDLAKKIHKDLMPTSFSNDMADIAITYLPAFYMGGDYAKFYFPKEDKLVFILADVTGHGVSAALLVNRIHTEVERLMRDDPDPGQMLKALEEFISKDFGKMGFFITAFCGMLDFSNKELKYSNYGHPPQMLLHTRDNNVMFLKSQTFLMGIGLDTGDIYSKSVAFEKGDRLVLFTDGIIEARDTGGDFFGTERLEEFTKTHTDMEVKKFNNELMKEVDKFSSGRQDDDIFLITIQT